MAEAAVLIILGLIPSRPVGLDNVNAYLLRLYIRYTEEHVVRYFVVNIATYNFSI